MNFALHFLRVAAFRGGFARRYSMYEQASRQASLMARRPEMKLNRHIKAPVRATSYRVTQGTTCRS